MLVADVVTTAQSLTFPGNGAGHWLRPGGAKVYPAKNGNARGDHCQGDQQRQQDWVPRKHKSPREAKGGPCEATQA